MFKLLVFFGCVCAVFGLPVDQPQLQHVEQSRALHPNQIVPIVSEEFDNNGDGNFHFGFVSGDGTKVQEEGTLKVYDEKTAEEVVRGSYEYVSPEGRNFKVDYYADGSGFHVFSDDIPKSAGVESSAQFESYVREAPRASAVVYNPVARSFPVAEQKVNVVPIQALPGNPAFNYQN